MPLGEPGLTCWGKLQLALVEVWKLGQRALKPVEAVPCDCRLDPPGRSSSGGEPVSAEPFGQMNIRIQALMPHAATAQLP